MEELIKIWQELRRLNKDFKLEIKDININGMMINDFKIDSFNEIPSLLNHYKKVYNPCEKCSNNPSNNPYASGNCNCALPYLNNAIQYTHDNEQI